LDKHNIRYVIGTEVPPPGGIQGEEDTPQPTCPGQVEETIELTKKAFYKRRLESAWERVIAVVVQPGVEFGNDIIYDYDRSQAECLKRFIESTNGLIYEAHSTDYQSRSALRQMVEDHFAILKVGPALTFAYREAVYAFAMIDKELFATRSDWQSSNIIETLEKVMLENQKYWQDYYLGSEEEKAISRHYSFSDRIRYYWPEERVQKSLNRLFNNLQSVEIPLSLLSQYLPVQFKRIRSGDLDNKPFAVIHDSISQVLQDYSFACGSGGTTAEKTR